ncbi:MAG: MgtC/SapB family protein [Gemmobacter sp.]|nr:MgtC/SapB family protein [Gemmobacter sp.]
MVPSIEIAALNMVVALTCGAVIGSERQVRQRMAGLRTNALVALGASAFVLFSSLYPNEVSPTRVAAQIVSGIGFLGAGIIFRDGFNVHGLNTAATLWCSAAVGMMAGSGSMEFAALLTGMVVFVNLGLRPLVKWIKRRTRAGLPAERAIRVSLTCRSAQESEVRALILRTLTLGGMHLSEVELRAGDAPDTVVLGATVTISGVSDIAVEQAVGRLAAEPGLLNVRWAALEDG